MMPMFRPKIYAQRFDDTATEYSDTDIQKRAPARIAPLGMWVARGVVLLALIPLATLYLGPRIYDLTATPGRLSQAVESADRYNPALVRLIDHERVTVSAFAALDEMRRSLTEVLTMDESVAADLNTLVDQISMDLQATLVHTSGNVSELVGSLDALTTRVNTLRAPANAAATALSNSRETMAAILKDVRSTADQVHNTRVSAESAANDLSGR